MAYLPIQGLGPEMLVPGHGPVGIVRDIQPMRDYILALQKAAKGTKVSEASRKSLIETPIPSHFNSMRWKALWRENMVSLIEEKL